MALHPTAARAPSRVQFPLAFVLAVLTAPGASWAAGPRPGIAIKSPDLSAYSCANLTPTTATTTRHIGQVILGRYYEWNEIYVKGSGSPQLGCVSILIPQPQQLDAAQALAFLTRSASIGVPTENAQAAQVSGPTAASPAAPSLEPPDVKPEPLKHVIPGLPSGNTKLPAPSPATQPNPALSDQQRSTPAHQSSPSSSAMTPARTAPAEAGSSDPRTKISAATSQSYPWNTVGYLSVTYPDGENFRCTGTVVSPYVVLTAGHCLHNRTRGGYVSQIRFYPGQSENSGGAATSPYGVATNWKNLQVTATWEQISGPDSFQITDYASDFAAIQFGSAFTYTSTFMPILYESVDSPVTNAGYPADITHQSATANALYSMVGDELSDSVNGFEFYNIREFNVYSTGGNSGGPFWITDSLGRSSLTGSLSYGGTAPDVSGGPWYGYWNYQLLSNWVAWTPGTPSASSLLSDGMHVSSIFSSAQTAGQSFLRFFNQGNVAGNAVVTLEDSVTGNQLASWTSPSIPAGAELQFAIQTIESQATPSFTRPAFYSLSVKPAITGYFQHVLYHPADGTLTNLSTCDSGSVNNSGVLIGVHSSLLNNGFPSTIVVYNTGTSPTAVQLGVYDARNGNQLGTYTTASIPANGQAMVAVPTIESALKITPDSTEYHYVIQTQNNFSGYLQNLVNNQRAGVVADMTTLCVLPPA